jgi:hypothetical protein
MREEVRRAFDEMSEAPHPALRSALRARLEAGPSREKPRVWRLTVAATLVAGLVGLAFVAGVSLLPRGGGVNLPAPAATVSATPSSEPTATPTAAPSPTATVASAPTTACATYGGGASSLATVTDVRVGTSAGYDRIVIQFDGPVPTYSITPQGNTTFMQDPNGQTFQLQGSDGIKVVVHGASGTDVNGNRKFFGSQDLKPGFPVLKEARQIGDFERTFSWGLGLAQPACLHVTEMTGPDRLVIDVLKP